MTKTFDEMMKLLAEKGSIAEEEGAKLIKEHGALTDEEKKDLAAAIKMRKALTKPAEAEKKDDGEPSSQPADGDKKDDKPAADAPKPAEAEKKDDGEPSSQSAEDSAEVSMDDYLQALSVLDSDEASKEDKDKAEKTKAKFESQ